MVTILQTAFSNENDCILIRISLKFVPKGPIDSKAALVQVVALHRTGDKPLPESVHRRIYAALGGDELIENAALTIWKINR